MKTTLKSNRTKARHRTRPAIAKFAKPVSQLADVENRDRKRLTDADAYGLITKLIPLDLIGSDEADERFGAIAQMVGILACEPNVSARVAAADTFKRAAYALTMHSAEQMDGFTEALGARIEPDWSAIKEAE